MRTKSLRTQRCVQHRSYVYCGVSWRLSSYFLQTTIRHSIRTMLRLADSTYWSFMWIYYACTQPQQWNECAKYTYCSDTLSGGSPYNIYLVAASLYEARTWALRISIINYYIYFKCDWLLRAFSPYHNQTLKTVTVDDSIMLSCPLPGLSFPIPLSGGSHVRNTLWYMWRQYVHGLSVFWEMVG